MYIVIGGIIVCGIIVSIVLAKKRSQQYKMQKIRDAFGSVPHKKFSVKDLEYLLESEGYAYEVDAVTWNDLSMDAVYSRINNCNSFIGEQVLYRELHCVSPDQKKIKAREEFIEQVSADTSYRESIQMVLAKTRGA